MSTDTISFRGPTEVTERSSANFTAAFRDSVALAAFTPTNVYWRLDDEAGAEIAGWTELSPPDTSVAIAVSADQNAIRNDARGVERKTLTVMADRGLSTQFAQSYSYAVRNLAWRA
jgi:hypothetical protein